MGSLLLIIDSGERRLPEQDPHYLWMDAGVLKVSTNPPNLAACVGHFVSGFGEWRFNTGPAECPPELRINGRPVEDDVELATGRAEVRLSAEPYSEPPPRDWKPEPAPDRASNAGPPPTRDHADTPRPYDIGPPGSGAQIVVDDPWVVPAHAWVEEDARGAWWVTANNGEIYVDGESVTSAVREPGSRFTVGRRVLTVPGGSGRRARGLSVECRGLSARRGAHQLLDNVSMSIPAGEFVAVCSPSPTSAQLLLGLLVGGYRSDRGAVRVGGSSRKGNPAVRWVSGSDDLHGLLTVGETLAGAEPDRRAELLSWLGLAADADAHRQVRTLNDGERKRLAIARELAGRPALLVIFESATPYAISTDRDLMSRLATVSRDSGCTIVVAAGTVANLDLARTVVILDRRGRLRYAGAPGGPVAHQPDVTQAGWLATLDVPTDEIEGGRYDPPLRLPPLRLRSPAAHGSDGLAAMLRLHAVLMRRRGNGILIGLAALAVLGAVAVTVTDAVTHAFAIPVLAGLIVVAALVTGGTDLATRRAQFAWERHSGTACGAIVAARLAVHGAACALLALPVAVAVDIAGIPLPTAPALGPWFSRYVTVLLAMVLALTVEMLAYAAIPGDRILPTVTLGNGVGTAAALTLLCWLLLSLSWAACVSVLLVLTVVGAPTAATVLDHRLG